jgi:hypothetical protein
VPLLVPVAVPGAVAVPPATPDSLLPAPVAGVSGLRSLQPVMVNALNAATHSNAVILLAMMNSFKVGKVCRHCRTCGRLRV